MPEKQIDKIFTEAVQSDQPGKDPHIDDKLEENLKQIAERIGVPADLELILKQIDKNSNIALKLEDDLKQVASHLGVPNTVGHIKQRIDEIEVAHRDAFNRGLSAGQTKQKLEHEHIRLLAKQCELKKWQEDWEKRRTALMDDIERQSHKSKT